MYSTPEPLDLAWFAGFYEGEGSLCASVGARSVQMKMQIASTDLDVLVRCQAIWLPIGNLSNHTRATDRHKQSWMYRISARDEVLHVARLIYPHLGVRRRLQIQTALTRTNEWRQARPNISQLDMSWL